MQRIKRSIGWMALTLALAAAPGLAAAESDALARMLREKGHRCADVASYELETVDRTGAIYRIACRDGGRFAVVVPEIAPRRGAG